MIRPRVVAARDLTTTDEVVFIGRPSKWGNPFRIGWDGSRAQVIEQYRHWIRTQPHLMDALSELSGMTLVCFCKPLACHGDVLADLVEERLLLQTSTEG